MIVATPSAAARPASAARRRRHAEAEQPEEDDDRQRRGRRRPDCRAEGIVDLHPVHGGFSPAYFLFPAPWSIEPWFLPFGPDRLAGATRAERQPRFPSTLTKIGTRVTAIICPTVGFALIRLRSHPPPRGASEGDSHILVERKSGQPQPVLRPIIRQSRVDGPAYRSVRLRQIEESLKAAHEATGVLQIARSKFPTPPGEGRGEGKPLAVPPFGPRSRREFAPVRAMVAAAAGPPGGNNTPPAGQRPAVRTLSHSAASTLAERRIYGRLDALRASLLSEPAVSRRAPQPRIPPPKCRTAQVKRAVAPLMPELIAEHNADD